MNDDAPSLGSNKGGFTIVETLIVLAVSSLMFLSAILLVAGQQRKVEFTQGVQDIRSVIEKTITEIGAGYYPNSGDIRCSAAGSNLNISAGSGTAQGSNTGCIFLGKAMQFGVNDTDPQQYIVHTIAGLQDNVGTLESAKPEAIDLENDRLTAELRNGITVTRMQYVQDGTRTNIGAVAFVNGLGEYGNNQLLSGSQQMSLVPVTGSGAVPNTDIASVVTAINSLENAPVNPNGGVEICFRSGGTKQSGLVTIGSNGRNLSVKLDIKSTVDCT